jgi:hypothetical protein
MVRLIKYLILCLCFIALGANAQVSGDQLAFVGPVAVVGGGVPSGAVTKPCTTTTQDGDGSTVLELCEMSNETDEGIGGDYAAVDWSGAGVTATSPASPCGNTHVLAEPASTKNFDYPSGDPTEFVTTFAIYVDSSTNDGDLLVAESNIETFAWRLQWRDTNDEFRLQADTGSVVNWLYDTDIDLQTWYYHKIWWDADGTPGIRWWITSDLGSGWTEIDLTAQDDDPNGADSSKFFEHTEEVSVVYYIGFLKVRFGSTAPPDTCS